MLELPNFKHKIYNSANLLIWHLSFTSHLHTILGHAYPKSAYIYMYICPITAIRGPFTVINIEISLLQEAIQNSLTNR